MLALILGLGLMACSIMESTPSDNVLEDDTDNSLTVVGFSQPGAESTWRVALTDSVKEAFTEERGYKLIYKDGQNKQDNQIRDIRTFIQQGVDYIILCPIVEVGWDTVLSEAKEADIPVIICDRNVVVSNENLYTAFVGSNFEAQGDYATSYLEDYFGEGDMAEKSEVNIVHIQGTIDSSAQIGRSTSLEKAVEANDNWNIVAAECGDFTKAKSRELMTGILEEIGSENIDVIYCENDEEAFGAMEALDEANVSYGLGTSIAIVSFDATARGLTYCLDGRINIDVECNPLQGKYLLNTVQLLEKGTAVPKITYVDEDYFTKDTLSEDFIAIRKY